MKTTTPLALTILTVITLAVGFLVDTTTLWDRFFSTKSGHQEAPPIPASSHTTNQHLNSSDQSMSAKSAGGSTSVNANNGSQVTIQQGK